MAALSTDTFALDASGTSITWNSCGGSGDTFSNNGRTIVLARNGASAATVTVAATQTVTDASLSVPNLTVSVSASTTIAIGPLPKATFNDSSSDVALTYTSSSTLLIAIVGW